MLESLIERKTPCKGIVFIQMHEHFTLVGHSSFLHDVSITLAEKKIDPSYFVKRENYCKDTLKTNTGMGMNLDSEHFCIYVIITVCRFSCKTLEFY